jgi:Cu+-exporting ATPase
MKVEPPSAAASVEFEGSTYYFCSKGCAASFESDPRHYVR